MSGFVEKFKLGKHYRMERFALLFFVLVILMSVVVGFCFAAQVNSNNQKLGNEAVYTTEFTTSKTNVTGTVEDVYVNSDHTRSFVLLHTEAISSISTDAENYQMFLTATDMDMADRDLISIPSGAFYIFGSTGYAGIYLVNQLGFEPQILNLTVRCNSELVPVSASVDEQVGETSFTLYDQFSVFFNPGASGATLCTALDADVPSISGIYAECVIAPQEAEVRDELSEALDTIGVDLAAIKEYTARAKQEGIAVNEKDIPELVGTDTLVTEDDGIRTYTVDKVVPTGFDFDWERGSVADGYLDDLMGGTKTTYTKFFAQKSAEAGSKVDTVPSYSDIEWFMLDGTPVEEYNVGSSSTGRYASLNNTIQLLTKAWSDYIVDKREYEVTLLRELLELEVDLDGIEDVTTINISDEVLLCY